MAKQTFTTGQVLTAAQMTSLQETAMGGGPATAKTANYVLVAADAGKTVAMDAAGATTITVDSGLFAAGDTVFIQNLGAGACTVTAGTATVATAGSLILPQNDAGILYFTSDSAAIFYDYIQVGAASPLTTKGDLYTYGTSDTRLPVGANGTTLVADSAEATGLKWVTPSATESSYTLLTSSTTTGVAAITLSFSACSDLLFQVIQTSTSGIIDITFNADATAKYDDFKAQLGQSGGTGFSMTTANNAIRTTPSRNGDETGFAMIVNGANKAGNPTYYGQSYYSEGGGTRATRSINGIYTANGPITSITITNAGANNFTAMTTKVYGRA